MDLSILPKEKDLDREGGTTGLLEVNIMASYTMEIYASREPFVLAMAVLLGSIRGPTTANKCSVTALQRILQPSFITVDMFALVVLYLFVV